MLAKASKEDLEQVRQQSCAQAWRSLIQHAPAAIAADLAAGNRQVEGTPLILTLADSGRPKPNTMRKIRQKQKRDTAVQAFVCAGIQQTIKRPVVVAFQHLHTSDQAAKWAVPSEWIYPILSGNPRKYMLETSRVFYDYSGVALCGSEMPCIELRRDPATVNAGYGCYNFLFVIPTPDEAAEIDFDHPNLIKMEWIKQKHAGTGEEVLLPWFPGPFGDRAYTMMPQVDKGATAKSLRGFDSGTNTLRWFYADELLLQSVVERTSGETLQITSN
jgi:hypothetical protein